MAEEEKKKKVSPIKKIKIPKKLMGEKFIKQTDLALARAKISFSAQEWAGMFVIIGIVLFLVLTVIFNIIYGVVGFGISLALMVMWPRMQADKRKGAIEDSLPDALHHMAVAIKTGLVLESVIMEIGEADYGPLSEEFAQVVLEIKRGRTMRDAFLNFALRSGSKDIVRAINLLLEGMESGGPISDVLDEVSEDMKSTKEVKQDRKTFTSQQISFLAMASLMAGPFVMGVVGALPEIMEAAMAGAGGGAGAPAVDMAEIYQVVDALTVYVILQAISSAIMMGVIMFGEFKSGVKFMIPMAIIAYSVYSVVKYIMPSAVSIF
ncbi:type II secretion system F family protein [archaeon]|nr:type II secretion system F family protein [archaeon]